jgi:hypothetical protein
MDMKMREQTNNELLLDIYASAWVIVFCTFIGAVTQWM